MRYWLVIFLVLLIGFFWHQARAVDPYDELQQQIDELARAREQSIAATKPLEGELGRLQAKLKGITAGIQKAKDDLRALEASLAEREAEFSVQYALLSERVLSYYKASRQPAAFLALFNRSTSGNLARDFFYRGVAVDRDKETIAQISLELIQLEKDKQKVEADKAALAVLQAKVDKEAKFFEGEIAGAKAYQTKLSQQIASLTAKQQQIINQRQAGLNLPQSLGAGPLYCTDDRTRDPGFSPAFAFFTYGIPHRVGMNQYGALGRAKAGQNHEQILQAYFANFSFETRPNIDIEVSGYGRMPLETYLLGIYEMPGDWPQAALQAQAIAARSYALAYTDNGAKPICTTQACQVYKGGNKGGVWEEAVKTTAGKTMISGGAPVTAWYSSTDGGYTFFNSDVWGGSQRPWTKRMLDAGGSVNSFGELNEKAFDRESPCFYSAQGWRSQYANSAWLKSSEAADIVNVLLLVKADSATAEHLYQTDKPHPFGGENWSEDRVKQELRQRGITPFNNLNSISVSADFNSGQTTTVSVNGDAGSQSFSGSEFKNYFNLRAPANIQIVGSLYNIEKR
jgi:SpoIID/LytB domain protein